MARCRSGALPSRGAAWLALVLALAAWQAAGAAPLSAIGVSQLPFSDKNQSAAWLLQEHQQFHGPFGAYLNTLLTTCGQDGFTFDHDWQATTRHAQFALLKAGADAATTIDIAFPIGREWAVDDPTQVNSLAGDVFIPIVTSPGTSILINKVFQPVTILSGLFNLDIIMILICIISMAVIAGSAMWLLDHRHRKSNFPSKFTNGAGIGFWWAIVSFTTVGYGDRVPKTKPARCFAVGWILVSAVMLALLQALVIANLTTSAQEDFLLSQQRVIDNVNGQDIGTLLGSVEEWRMRSRGAKVKTFPDFAAAMADVEDASSPIDGLAVDTLAAGVVARYFPRTARLRPSGNLQQITTYGFLLSEAAAKRPATNKITGVDGELATCLYTMSHWGTDELDIRTYFRGYVDLAFEDNSDIADQQQQEATLDRAQVTAAIILPVLALVIVLIGIVYDRWRAAGCRGCLTRSVEYDPLSIHADAEPPKGDRATSGTVTSRKASHGDHSTGASNVTSPAGAPRPDSGDIADMGGHEAMVDFAESQY